MSTTKSHLVAALDELQTERAHLAARLAKVDDLIAAMRDVFHLPAVPAPREPRPARPVKDRRAKPNGHAADTALMDAVTSALRAGPLSVGTLETQLGVSRYTVRQALDAMVQQGIVVITGATSGRRVALAGRPAKEAP